MPGWAVGAARSACWSVGIAAAVACSEDAPRTGPGTGGMDALDAGAGGSAGMDAGAVTACDDLAPPEGPEQDALSLPLLPRTEIDTYALASPELSTSARAVVEYGVSLAFGPEYPSAVSLTFTPIIDVRCCCDLLGDAVTLDTVTVLEGQIDVTRTGPATVSIAVPAEGAARFEASGEISVPEGALDGCSAYDDTRRLPVTYSISVDARRPEWQLDAPARCAPELAIQSGRPLPFTLSAVDAAGSRFGTMNVRQPGLTVTGDGVRFRAGASAELADVTAVGSGAVTVRVDDGGAMRRLSVVEAAQIDEMDVAFAIPGVAGGELVLVNGESYGMLRRRGNRVVAVVTGLRSQGTTLCSAARASDFQVTSDTPDTCPMDGTFCRTSEVPAGDLLPHSTRVVADGTCSMRVDAPEFAGGAGLSAEISATLLDTHLLLELAPE